MHNDPYNHTRHHSRQPRGPLPGSRFTRYYHNLYAFATAQVHHVLRTHAWGALTCEDCEDAVQDALLWDLEAVALRPYYGRPRLPQRGHPGEVVPPSPASRLTACYRRLRCLPGYVAVRVARGSGTAI